MSRLRPQETTLSFLHDKESFSITTTETVEPGLFEVRSGAKSGGRWHAPPVAVFRVAEISAGLTACTVMDGDPEVALAAYDALLGEGLAGFDRGMAVTEGFLMEALQAMRHARAITLTGRNPQGADSLNALRKAATLAATAAEEIRQVHGPLHLKKWSSPWPE